ncbi:hypothetical protein NP233_g2682 [Leucocoprinus birnbaumii]|uniref:Major facilitator superfamily (MFS) profile domain-containing protein n=1 Tax=Leucocoprinus birnbaumii TaxID=56174 RepID=A0AAD5YYJ8_9AGAR|nr:hypothetical protein NP233_g2682 [Leucocoprinus birnbaumii]
MSTANPLNTRGVETLICHFVPKSTRMSTKVVICGAGFLGSNIARQIANAPAVGPLARRVQLSSRNPTPLYARLEREVPSGRLLPPVALDITKPSTLTPAFENAGVVVSLVGLMHGSPQQFEDIQWHGAENVARAARQANAKLVHFSAIGADPTSQIPYARTKGLAEKSVLEICPNATIIRPSLVFGPEDDFFNRFAKLARFLPFLPVYGGGTARFQPVYVGDLARAVEVISRLDPNIEKQISGRTTEAGGPDIFTFKQLMELVLKYTNRHRPIISLPFSLGYAQGAVLEKLPLNLFTVTRAQVEQLRMDNVVTEENGPANFSFSKLIAEGYDHSPLESLLDILPRFGSSLMSVNQPKPINMIRIASPFYGCDLIHYEPDAAPPPPPFDDKQIFTKREKWLIVTMIAFFWSIQSIHSKHLLPSNTHPDTGFPQIHRADKSDAPMLWGTLSDNWGRRPITAACLLVLALSCVGLALTPTSAYWLLMVLRCLQAAGSASTIAIGAGVVSDISTPEERGGFFGFFTLGPMVGPAIGPVIGGAFSTRTCLSVALNRSIFWFMCIAASMCLVIIVLIMPETLLSVRYKKTRMARIVYTPFIPVVGRRKKGAVPENIPELPKKPFQNPFKLFAKPDIVLLLIVNAIICSVFYGVLASISTLFNEVYGLDATKTGLCFLAMGGGMAFGSSLNGKLLDKYYELEKKRFLERISKETGEQIDVKTLTKNPDFPLERARLGFMPVLVVILAAATVGYGWALEKHANIAGPLILQIIIGYLIMGVMNGSSTIMLDLVPGQGSAVTACNNLVRCLLSAALVSIIQLIFDAIGIGWTYVLLAGITLLALPFLFLELKYGPRIRRKRFNAQTH